MRPLNRPSILFLITANAPHNDNHIRIPAMFADEGWEVACAEHASLQWQGQSLWASTHDLSAYDLSAYDLVWPIGFGPARGYADRTQWLHLCRTLITPMPAWTFLHGKAAWLAHAAETHMASSADPLINVLQTRGGKWVLKPNAGSLGRDVHKVSDADAIRRAIRTPGAQSWLLQRYIEAIEQGETRTLVCGGEVLGSYLRVPKDGFQANLAQGALAQPTQLAQGEAAIVTKVHQRLCEAEVGFAAIDTAGGYLIEVNIANPGGISTLETLYGRSLGPRLVSATADLVRKRTTST